MPCTLHKQDPIQVSCLEQLQSSLEVLKHINRGQREASCSDFTSNRVKRELQIALLPGLNHSKPHHLCLESPRTNLIKPHFFVHVNHPNKVQIFRSPGSFSL